MCFALCWGAGAFAEPLLLAPGSSAKDVDAAFRFLPDDGASPERVIAAFRSGRGVERLGDANRAATEAYQPIWAHLRLLNGGASDEGGGVDEWLFVADAYGLLSVEVYVQRADGRLDYLLSYAFDEPFDRAERSLGRLRSAPIALERGEDVDLLVRYQFGPVMDAGAHLETPQDFADQIFVRGVGLSAFYAFSFALLLFFIGFLASLRNLVGIGYAGLFLLLLLFLAYIDGFAFRFIYPEAPDWHFPFGVALLNVASAVGFFLAGVSLRAPDPAPSDVGGRLSRRLRWAALAPAGILASALLLPRDVIAQLSYLGAVMMLGAQIYVISRWRAPLDEEDEERNRAASVFLIAALVAGALTAALFLMQAVAGGRFALSPPLFLKLLFVIVAGLTMAALTVLLIDLRRRHQRALETRMTALSAEAEEAQARLAAEQAYARARETAHLRQRQLAAASHDIRQPLAALKMGMESLAGRLSAQEAERIGQALNYLGGLADQYLDETRPQDAASPPAETTEPYALALILGGVREMFSEEAVSKGLRLHVVDSSVQTIAPPLAVMRIISNLVANAVRYTERGRVLVGVRRRGAQAEIWVIDTGPGLSPDELEQFGAAYVKGARSNGEGLGLAICQDIAKREDFKLRACSEPARGTVFRLGLRASTPLSI